MAIVLSDHTSPSVTDGTFARKISMCVNLNFPRARQLVSTHKDYYSPMTEQIIVNNCYIANWLSHSLNKNSDVRKKQKKKRRRNASQIARVSAEIHLPNRLHTCRRGTGRISNEPTAGQLSTGPFLPTYRRHRATPSLLRLDKIAASSNVFQLITGGLQSIFSWTAMNN